MTIIPKEIVSMAK